MQINAAYHNDKILQKSILLTNSQLSCPLCRIKKTFPNNWFDEMIFRGTQKLFDAFGQTLFQ